MKKNLSELVFILDRSGSMSGLESDTIGGFNGMIEKQKAMGEACLVSTVVFNQHSKVVHDRVSIDEIEKMNKSDFVVYGSTALVDALGCSIHHIANIHMYARKEDIPQHTIFVIMTDGMENASYIYSSDEVKRMIQREKEKYGWEFMFLGANIDAVETAKMYGINEDRAVNYKCDSMGTEVCYRSISDTLFNMRAGREVRNEWKRNIEHDLKNRK